MNGDMNKYQLDVVIQHLKVLVFLQCLQLSVLFWIYMGAR